MNYWSNIEVSPQDPEIIKIDTYGKGLGQISKDVKNVRELIRRFEVCHFKYKVHLMHINNSILNLSTNIEPTAIGENHVSKGKRYLKRDTTGRSVLGQQYICSLKGWLGDQSQKKSDYFRGELNQKIEKWLGDSSPGKERLVNLLVSRIMWDWDSYKVYQHSETSDELELQVCRMDICHYAFPDHLDRLLQGIGRMEPLENFEGCGSFNAETKRSVEEQFVSLCDSLRLSIDKGHLDNNARLKVWLMASMAKTLKEQVGLKIALPHLK